MNLHELVVEMKILERRLTLEELDKWYGRYGWQNFGYNRRMGNARSPYVWDYDIDEATFADILAGRSQIGRLDQDWAAVRLLEYAPYPEIVRRLGFAQLVAGWPLWRGRVRAQNRRRGLDFLVTWLPDHHPELL